MHHVSVEAVVSRPAEECSVSDGIRKPGEMHTNHDVEAADSSHLSIRGRGGGIRELYAHLIPENGWIRGRFEQVIE